MKILFDARTAVPKFPGIGRYSIELGAALANLVPETGDELVLLVNPKGRKLFNKLEHAKIIESDDMPNSPVCSLAMMSIAKEVKADIYHTPNRICMPPAFLPTVLTVHDCTPLRCPYENRPQERIAYAASMKSALKTCTRAIAVSEVMRADVEELFPDAVGKISVVRHGVAEAFKPADHRKQELAADKYGYTPPAMLYIGNNKRHKNLIELFNGYARAEGMIHGVGLILAGYGCVPLSRHKRCMKELGITDKVAWIGEVEEEDLPDVISSATAFVMPSRYEGFCLPIAEAMACGTPVACSDIPEFHEVAGASATYFQPDDPESIAQAIVTVVNDNIVRNRNRASGIERVRKYKWDAVARETRAVYEEALSKFHKTPGGK